jgi:hypothetical protein
MVFAGPTSSAQRENRGAAIVGRIRASRRANLPRLPGFHGYNRKCLTAFETHAIRNDRDIFESRLISRLENGRAKEAQANQKADTQTNCIKAREFAEQSHNGSADLDANEKN